MSFIARRSTVVKSVLSAAILCLLPISGHCQLPNPQILRDGDVIFQTSLAIQSATIQKITNSPYSHVGVIFINNGAPYVLEAVQPVKFTPLKDWVDFGVGQHFIVKRLKQVDTVLTEDVDSQMRALAQGFLGKSYDNTFQWSDDQLYCSELVWKLYDRAAHVQLGRPQRLKDLNLTDPAVQAELKNRYGSHVPLDETVISPGAMFDCPELVTVLKE